MDEDPNQLIFKVLAVLALVGANAFFVAAELSFVGVRRSRIQELADAGNANARRLLNILVKLDDYISATQVGITIASLALGWLGEKTLAHVLNAGLEKLLGRAVSDVALHGASVALSFAVITVLHVVLGEQVPKIMSLQSTEKVALACVRPMELFTVVFRPAIFTLNGMANRFVRLLGYKVEGTLGHRTAHSEEELKIIVRASRRHGVLEPSEEELIHSVLQFTDRTVEEVMRPRPDMDVVPENIALPDLLNTIAETEHSRYPVYRENQDNIVGIIHVKDLLEQLAEAGPEGFSVTKIMRPALMVPETRRLPDLLATLRRKTTHMAIVLDEFGDVAGLVTMEDVLEELVGDIHDEFDEPEKWFEKISDYQWVISGTAPLEETNKRLGLSLPSSHYNSLGGYIFGRLGHVPKVGDEVHENGYTLRVQAVDGFRVTRVVCHALPEKTPNESSAAN